MISLNFKLHIFDNKSHGKTNLDFRGVKEIPLDGADPPLHPLRTEGVRDLEIHLLHDIVVDFRSREVEGARELDHFGFHERLERGPTGSREREREASAGRALFFEREMWLMVQFWWLWRSEEEQGMYIGEMDVKRSVMAPAAMQIPAWTIVLLLSIFHVK
jgi:hypothetical protein